jgi:PAS domain S-box-containing protein
MSLRLRLTIEWILIGVAGTLFTIFAVRSELTTAFDNLFYDRLSSIHRPVADGKILLVNIDQVSLNKIGKWPWPRATHARLLDQLQLARPRSITVDILLSEQGDAADDAALSKAIAHGPSPVLLPMNFDTPGDDGRAYNAVQPIPEFARAASGIGQVNVTFDNDGKVRRTTLCFDPENSGQRWPHIMELVYRIPGVNPSDAYSAGPCGSSLLIAYSKRGTYSEASYSDVLAGNIPAGLIRDRDIIIGASAAGMGDSFPVPDADGALLAGSEILANILTGIRRDNFFQPVSRPLVIIFSLLPMWLLLIGFLQWLPRTALIASSAMILIIFGGSIAALSGQLWFPPGAALLALLLVYPLWGWRRLQAMSDFMGKELAELELEGETLPLRVMQAKAGDFIGKQSAALASAIDHMRDLRLFMTNTLSDLPDPMVATDVSGVVTLASDIVDRRMGQSILGLRLKSILNNIVIAEDWAAVDDYLSKFASGLSVTVPSEIPEQSAFVRFRTSDGGTFVMRQSRIETAAGELQGYIFYLADISALANAAAEREEVLQLLSHDMRAPQSAIIASLSGDIDLAAKTRIGNNARLTIKLAQDFVDIARMAETAFEGEDLLVADLVRDVADNFWPLAHERAIRIDVIDNTDCAFVLAEPEALTRAFSNLVDNAVKFSPENAVIEINLSRSETGIQIAVTDTGPGIDAEMLPRLFERFTTSAHQAGRVKGMGLGLNYVQAVIKRHRGSTTVRNLAGGGSCFTVELPEAPDRDIPIIVGDK